jgi:hypothetical protein
MGEPMAIDSGVAGLEQSDHYPVTGQSQYPPPSQTTDSKPLVRSQDVVSDLATTII